MPYYVELKNDKGRTIYDTTLRNFSLISRQRVIVPPAGQSPLIINIPNPQTTIPFVRIEGGYEANVALLASVSGSQVGLILAPPPSGAAVSKPAIVYLMGVGTTGIAPEYGAVIRNEAGAVEWSSLDNPLFIRTVAITDAHATPNTSIVAGRSIAVCPSITGTIKRNGGNAFSVITGFSDGLRAQAFGNFGGSGAWSWNTSLTPRLDDQVYIETAYMD